VALRPVWWVLRGYGVYVFILYFMLIGHGRLDDWMVPNTPLEWVAVTAAVIVSAQWGRGMWLPANRLRHVRTVASIIAIISLPFAVGAALSPRVEYVGDEYVPEGLMLDGVQVNNIFAFDSEGNPIDRVQLFTGKGTPLNLYGENGGQVVLTEDGQLVPSQNGGNQEFGLQDDGMRATVPSDDYRGRPVWNVYPLDEADVDIAFGMPDGSTTKRPEPPFQKAPDLDATDPTPSASPGPDSTPQPTTTPAP